MSIPQNKDELISDIKNSYQKLKNELENITENISSELSLDGHQKNSKMSINNLISYLIGWGELVLKWHKNKNSSKQVYFPEEGYKWNELGKLAQKFYKDYEKLSFSELKDKLDYTVNNILNLVEKYSNKELYEEPWYEKWTMGRMIQFNTSSPYKNARFRIRKWKKEKKF